MMTINIIMKIFCTCQARRRLRDSGCFAVMTGRGALVKPWIFQEFRRGEELSPSARCHIFEIKKTHTH